METVSCHREQKQRGPQEVTKVGHGGIGEKQTEGNPLEQAQSPEQPAPGGSIDNEDQSARELRVIGRGAQSLAPLSKPGALTVLLMQVAKRSVRD